MFESLQYLNPMYYSSKAPSYADYLTWDNITNPLVAGPAIVASAAAWWNRGAIASGLGTAAGVAADLAFGFDKAHKAALNVSPNALNEANRTSLIAQLKGNKELFAAAKAIPAASLEQFVMQYCRTTAVPQGKKNIKVEFDALAQNPTAQAQYLKNFDNVLNAKLVAQAQAKAKI